MNRLVKFPDGTRLLESRITFYNTDGSGTINVGLNGSGASATYSYGAYSYAFADEPTAQIAIAKMDNWFYLAGAQPVLIL